MERRTDGEIPYECAGAVLPRKDQRAGHLGERGCAARGGREGRATVKPLAFGACFIRRHLSLEEAQSTIDTVREDIRAFWAARERCVNSRPNRPEYHAYDDQPALPYDDE